MPVKAPSFRPSYVPAPKEQAKLYDRDRGSPSKRGYGRRWQKARLAYLQQHPLCVACQAADGSVVPAAEVDHVIPHNGDQVMFWDQANWQSLCSTHHSQKTRAESRR